MITKPNLYIMLIAAWIPQAQLEKKVKRYPLVHF